MGRSESVRVGVTRWTSGSPRTVQDDLAAEEPLQLRLDGRALSVIMRTPGHDIELALGLLHAEGVIKSLQDVDAVESSAEAGGNLLDANVVDVVLCRPPATLPERSFLASSACGVCGATTMESLARDFPRVESELRVSASLLPALAGELRRAQPLFDVTGGLHGAALFDVGGRLLVLREDVGRHNAVDKVVGRLLLDDGLPAAASILVVSGRLGYEVVQKAVAASIPVVVGVGAASSLAVMTARRFNQTLVGFLRGERFNVYAGEERVGA